MVGKIAFNTGELRQIRSGDAISVNNGQSFLPAAISVLRITYFKNCLYIVAMIAGQVADVMPHLLKEKQCIYLIYPSDRFTQPVVRAFIDFLVRAFVEKSARRLVTLS